MDMESGSVSNIVSDCPKVFARPCIALSLFLIEYGPNEFVGSALKPMFQARGGVDDSEMMLTGDEVHAAYTEHLPQHSSRDLHWAGRGSGAGRGLREGGGHGGAERNIALHLLHHLVDVPVENGDRADALEDRESLRATFGSPPPFGIDGPERNVREDDNGRAGAQSGGILGEPSHLLRADFAETFKLDAVVEANEVDTFVVKTLPGFARGGFAKASKIHFAVVSGGVVFSGGIENLRRPLRI
jgi:hypothetical protein